MRIWRRNWIIKRIALGFAVAALVAPAAAQARVDEGGIAQPNSTQEIVKGAYVPFVTDFPKYEPAQVKVGPSGMPHAGRNDYLSARDGVEVARTQPRSTLRTSDVIENVRISPRDSGSQVEASPGLDWSDAGIGAGLAIALLLVGGAAFLATRHLGRAQTA
jgi:hypothetical protein